MKCQCTAQYPEACPNEATHASIQGTLTCEAHVPWEASAPDATPEVLTKAANQATLEVLQARLKVADNLLEHARSVAYVFENPLTPGHKSRMALVEAIDRYLALARGTAPTMDALATVVATGKMPNNPVTPLTPRR